ncbi:MAG: glycoside-pentoside-hexuronide (GPH):cation symporter [Clostridia bacterium]|nr:glycoside-pentoside-hexuronide (GPH):cation symporter [Clostridia bacterium]
MADNTNENNLEVQSAVTDERADGQASVVGERISTRNLIMYPLGTLGRDFLYNFFNSYLLTFILLTKTLTNSQFASITIIIVCARIFDAFNDPIMGGIVENTRTKWGKYKPWQLIGAVLTGAVIIALFNVNLNGWAFIGFLAFAYFMFSITFTMNDISYWGMMPTLTTNPHDRNKLTSFTQIICAAGGGLAGLLVPALTTGAIGTAVFGNAVTGYRVLSILISVMMVAFQLFTLLGVKEKPLPANFVRTERMKFKDLFRVIFKNDQLLWCSLVMLIFNVGTNVVAGGLSTFYIYFEFAYDGMLVTAFGIGFAILSVVFTLGYPWLSKKFGRDRMLYSTGLAIIVGYLLMMIIGLAIPSQASFNTPLGIAKFALLTITYTLAGWGSGFYMIMVINMANTVEYNEYKTGKREEGLIFSLRPLTAKLGSALMQGVVSIVFIISGVLTVTNAISDLENQQASNLITPEAKLEGINNIIAGVSQQSKMILLVCMCLIPAVFLTVALIIYKKKCILNEKKMEEMVAEIERRKQADGEEQKQVA